MPFLGLYFSGLTLPASHPQGLTRWQLGCWAPSGRVRGQPYQPGRPLRPRSGQLCWRLACPIAAPACLPPTAPSRGRRRACSAFPTNVAAGQQRCRGASTGMPAAAAWHPAPLRSSTVDAASRLLLPASCPSLRNRGRALASFKSLLIRLFRCDLPCFCTEQREARLLRRGSRSNYPRPSRTCLPHSPALPTRHIPAVAAACRLPGASSR